MWKTVDGMQSTIMIQTLRDLLGRMKDENKKEYAETRV